MVKIAAISVGHTPTNGHTNEHCVNIIVELVVSPVANRAGDISHTQHGKNDTLYPSWYPIPTYPALSAPQTRIDARGVTISEPGIHAG